MPPGETSSFSKVRRAIRNECELLRAPSITHCLLMFMHFPSITSHKMRYECCGNAPADLAGAFGFHPHGSWGDCLCLGSRIFKTGVPWDAPLSLSKYCRAATVVHMHNLIRFTLTHHDINQRMGKRNDIIYRNIIYTYIDKDICCINFIARTLDVRTN